SFTEDGHVEVGARLKNGKWRVFATAFWQSGVVSPDPGTITLDDMRHRATVTAPNSPFSAQFGPVSVSDRWDCQQSVHYDPVETLLLKNLRLKYDYQRDMLDWPFHPAIADIAVSMPLAKMGTGYVPVGIDQITVHGGSCGDIYAGCEIRENGLGTVVLYDA
ncbi:MAG: hypothetical protein RLN85_01095, partial [Pseudomonadales bacterium]